MLTLLALGLLPGGALLRPSPHARSGALLLSAAATTNVASVIDQHAVRHSLQALDEKLFAFQYDSSSAAPVVGACLDVMRSVEPSNAMLPDSVQLLREAAAFFAWDGAGGAELGQHLFDVPLWDDALAALARVVVEPEVPRAYKSATWTARANVVHAAEAVAATARFVLLDCDTREAALDKLEAAVMGSEFLDARRGALAIARHRRITRPRARTADAADASDPGDDERVVKALYACAVHQLDAPALSPLGFPASKLGLRSLVGAARAAGSQRAAAALGRIWHASEQPAPIIVHEPSAESASGRPSTLVIAFSSLGWFGLVRAEWGATLRSAAADGRIVVAHALDTAQSWWTTNPMTGDFDDGAWWDTALEELCAPYDRVCLLGESLGATGALRFARHATHSIVALVPQIELRDFDYASRPDFDDARKAALRTNVMRACEATAARVNVHVGRDEADLRQLAYLPPEGAGSRVRVVRHAAQGHALGAGLKEQGVLLQTVLGDLLDAEDASALTSRSSSSSSSRDGSRAAAAASMSIAGGGSIVEATDATSSIDADVVRLGDGSFFNARLGARNVWEVDLDPALVDEAAAVLYGRDAEGGSVLDAVLAAREPYLDVRSSVGDLFSMRVTNWQSDIAWVSVDEQRAYDAFESLFRRMRLPERFAAVVPHAQQLRLYSAFYVVRSRCAGENFHVDYKPAAGVDALTLITPLHDFDQTRNFQLTYRHQQQDQTSKDQVASSESSGEEARRYVYQKGKAVVFGSLFDHSTEPGAGRDGQPHAYLCFTFGTDREASWPNIARTIDTQSRVVVHPDGEMRLSQLGEQIEELVRAAQAD